MGVQKLILNNRFVLDAFVVVIIYSSLGLVVGYIPLNVYFHIHKAVEILIIYTPAVEILIS
jgi:hypothetical protein